MIKFYVQFYDCYLLNKLKKFGAEKIVIDGNLVSFSIKKKHEKYLRRILNNYEYTWDENLNFQKTYVFSIISLKTKKTFLKSPFHFETIDKS
ncbi:MAG: hypothetical protein LBH47_01935, partial [Christensenellaceae bacterium]|nr:hypothetical protein [Christensenellaceae bacterium]